MHCRVTFKVHQEVCIVQYKEDPPLSIFNNFSSAFKILSLRIYINSETVRLLTHFTHFVQ